MESDDPVIHRRPAEPVERLHEQLRESLQVLVTSEDWRQALAVAARFHDYSFANTRLIWSAAAVRGFAPDRVAGYRTWQKLGRQVRRGEKGLSILAPVTRKIEAPDGAEEEEERRAVGFNALSAKPCGRIQLEDPHFLVPDQEDDGGVGRQTR